MTTWWILARALLGPAQGDAAATHDVDWWDAPAACPDADHAARRITQLGGDPAVVRPRVRIEADDAGFTAHVTIERGSQTESRVLQAEQCGALTEAVALVIAIAPTEPGPTPTEEPDAPSTDPLPEPPTPAVDPPVKPSADTSGTRAPVRTPRANRSTPRNSSTRGLRYVGIAITGGLSLGAVPGVAPTIGGGVAIGGGRWRAEARARGTTPTRARADAPNDAVEVIATSGTGALRGAFVVQRGRFELPIFGGLELGAVRARSTNASRGTTRASLWSAIEAGVQAGFAPISAVSLALEVAGALHLTRPRFGLHTPTGDVVAFESRRVGFRALAAVEFRLAAFGARSRGR